VISGVGKTDAERRDAERREGEKGRWLVIKLSFYYD